MKTFIFAIFSVGYVVTIVQIDLLVKNTTLLV